MVIFIDNSDAKFVIMGLQIGHIDSDRATNHSVLFPSTQSKVQNAYN